MFSQSYIQPPSSQTSLYSTNNTLGFADLTPNFGSQSDLGVLGSQDTNSPEAFKQNIMVVIEQLARVQVFARNIINGIEQAYRPGTNPSQTSANMLNLRHAIEILQELLRTSGVGALPLLNLQQHPAPQLPSEEQLLADTTNATQQLFERLKNLQESSTIVTNLLSIPDQQRK